jgi:hypothetical protein
MAGSRGKEKAKGRIGLVSMAGFRLGAGIPGGVQVISLVLKNPI